ncbi:MAG: hypothetical protein ABR555_18475 [Pyrinomonadaceae bacterium]
MSIALNFFAHVIAPNIDRQKTVARIGNRFLQSRNVTDVATGKRSAPGYIASP